MSELRPRHISSIPTTEVDRRDDLQATSLSELQEDNNLGADSTEDTGTLGTGARDVALPFFRRDWQRNWKHIDFDEYLKQFGILGRGRQTAVYQHEVYGFDLDQAKEGVISDWRKANYDSCYRACALAPVETVNGYPVCREHRRWAERQTTRGPESG